MSIQTKNDFGVVTIADSVLATIAGMAAMQCAGIVGMASQGAAEGIAELLKIESLTKGVKAITNEDTVVIDINVILEYGVSMVAVADNVIGSVKFAIESMTGLKVESVKAYACKQYTDDFGGHESEREQD